MGKIYTNPFDWGYADDNTLIYVDTSEDGIKSMINQALDDALDDVKDEIVDETMSSMDIKLEGENLLYKLIVNGNENGEINIPKDQFLKSTTYDSENKKLIFVMQTVDGESTIEVSISDLVASIEEKNQEQDTVLAEKADKSELEPLAVKSEVESALADKADTSALEAFATKEEVAAAVAPLAVKAEVTEEINSAVDGLNAALTDKADASALETLATKAEVETVDAKVEAIEVPSIEGLAKTEDVTAEIAAAVEPLAVKTDVDAALEAKADKTELEPLAVKAEVTEEIAAAVEPLATKEEVANKVDWVESTPDRKHIVLKNHDSILGTATDGTTYNVAMVSKWDVADFGSAQLHLNLNSKDAATINDDQVIATENVVDAKIEAAVSAINSKDEAQDAEIALKAVKADVDAALELKVDKTELEPLAKSADVTAEIAAAVEPLATKEELTNAAAEAVAKVVAEAPEDFDTLKEVADYIAADKTKATEIENKLSEHDAAVEALNAKDVELNAAIVDEATRATAAESELTGKVVAEQARAEAKEAELAAKDEAQDVVINGKVDRNMNGANGKALIFNESDGGGAKFEHNDGTWSFAGVNDGGENGIAGQIYAVKKNAEGKMEGTRIDVTKGAMYYTVGAASAAERMVANNEIAVKGDVKTVNDKVDALEIPSIEGLAKSADVTAEIASAVSVLNTKDEAQDAEIALKADSDKVYTKEDVNNTLEGYVPLEQYNDLKARLDNLEIMMSVYNAEREAQMDEIISNMSSDNKEVVTETLMESIVVPETTVAYTITAPLTDNSTVELTSPKYMTLINTSKEPVSTTISHTYAEGESTSATTVYLVGDFDTLTLENISPSVKSGYDAASVKNVIIPETNVKNLSLSLDFQDGATITNNSDKDITIYDKSNSEIALSIVAPNSTVTLNNGQFTTLNAEVSDNTLIIKKNVHIGNLNLERGNAIVEVARAEEVAGIVENYTVADGYTLSHRVYHITNENSSKLGGTGEMILDEDITRTSSIVTNLAPAYDAVWNLNGHNITVEGSPKNGVYLNRYTSNLEVKGEGVIRAEGCYGLWNAATTGKIIINDGVTIEAQTHAVYAEKGVIEINAGTFKLTNWADAEKDANGNLKFLINCYDANYTNGSANIIVKGGKFYDFNPAVSYGEPNGPVSFVAEGYGVVESTEMIDGVEHRVYEVKPING